jgi:hypothetical protein
MPGACFRTMTQRAAPDEPGWIACVIHLDESRHIQATAATAMPVETIMNGARTLLLTALLVLNSSAHAAAAATAVLYAESFGLHILAVAFDPMRAGTGRLVAAPISNLLALLGVGLLVALGARIVRRRR